MTEDLRGNMKLILGITLYPTKGGVTYCQGLPYLLESRYGPSEEPLTKTNLFYEKGGRVHRKAVLDTNSKPLKETIYIYEKGCLKSEENTLEFLPPLDKRAPRGKKRCNPKIKATYGYDQVNNITSFRDFGSRVEKQISYNGFNRPLQIKERGEHQELCHRFEYNHRGHRIASYDCYHYKTY